MRQAFERVPPIAWLLLLALIVLAAGMGLRDPWPADEPRFALIARDMVASGEWFFPRVAGVLYPDKPPVFFWLIAVFYAVTGSLRIAFLMPSLLAGLGALWLAYDLGKRLWNERVGLYASAILLVTLQFALQARTAQIDATLMFWTTLGFYGIARHLLLGDGWRWYVLGFAAAGAGVITKGVGILPLLLFVPWAFARWRGWNELPAPRGGWRWLAGPLAMLAVIALWFLPMLIFVEASHDPAYAAYRDNILFKQTGERYANAWHHIKPFWYYIVEVIPLFWLPVTLALPWLAPAWVRDLKARDPRVFLLLGWIALIVVFFSVSPGKRGVYILPAVPALALVAAPYARLLLQRKGLQYLGWSVLALFAALWSLALLYFLVVAPAKGQALIDRYEVVPWTLFTLFAVTAAAWLFLKPRRGMFALSGYFLSLWVILGFYGYPLLNDVRSPAWMMDAVAERIGPDAELALVDWKEQLVLHADRPVTHFGFRRRDIAAEMDDGLRWLMEGDDRYLLFSDVASDECVDRGGIVHAGFMHRTNWWLATSEDIAPGCRERLREEAPPEDAVKAMTPDTWPDDQE